MPPSANPNSSLEIFFWQFMQHFTPQEEVIWIHVRRLRLQVFRLDSCQEAPLAGLQVGFMSGGSACRSSGWIHVRRLRLQVFRLDSCQEAPLAGLQVGFRLHCSGGSACRSSGWIHVRRLRLQVFRLDPIPFPNVVL